MRFEVALLALFTAIVIAGNSSVLPYCYVIANCCLGDGQHCLRKGLKRCHGACVDLQTDDKHCGRCRGVCDSDEICVAGICTPVTPPSPPPQPSPSVQPSPPPQPSAGVCEASVSFGNYNYCGGSSDCVCFGGTPALAACYNLPYLSRNEPNPPRCQTDDDCVPLQGLGAICTLGDAAGNGACLAPAALDGCDQTL